MISARKERGTLIASGFIAGGAIMGVFAAAIVYVGQIITENTHWNLKHVIGTEFVNPVTGLMEGWMTQSGSEILGFAMFALLLFYLYWDSKRAKVE